MGQQQRPRKTKMDNQDLQSVVRAYRSSTRSSRNRGKGDRTREECAYTDLVQNPWFHQQWSVQCQCWYQRDPSASWQHLPPSSPTHAPAPLRTPRIHALTHVPYTLDVIPNRTATMTDCSHACQPCDYAGSPDHSHHQNCVQTLMMSAEDTKCSLLICLPTKGLIGGVD